MKNFTQLFVTTKLFRQSSIGTLVLILTILLCDSAFAQPGSMSNNTDCDGSYNNNAMTTVGLGSNNSFFSYREQANATSASGTKFYQFNTDSYFNTWNLNTPTYNSVQTTTWCGGCGYNGGIKMGATTNLNYYTFNLRRGNSYANQSMAILETSYLPRNISSYTTPVAYSTQTPTMTVTLSAALQTNEFVYVAYSTDGFASSGNSGVLSVTSSAAPVYTFTLPAYLNGTVVTFYPFTSVASVAPSYSDAPLLTLNMRSSTGQNNTGAYSTYTVQAWQFNGTTNSLWSVGTNWNAGVAPPTSANLGSITINNNCNQDQAAIVGALAINDTRTLTINTNNILQVGGAITRGGANNGALTVNGTLQLNTGSFTTFAPNYGSGSTLIYNSGGTYGRSTEWNATSGAGYPFNVQVGNGVNTTLNMNNGANAFRKMAGNLTVSSGSVFNLNGITNDNAGNGICVEVVGDIVNNGTINFTGATKRLKATSFTNGVTTGVTNLSTVVGGDLEVTANFTDNNTFNANNRAVFFTGTGTQVVSGSATAPFNIDYIVSNKASGTIQLGVDLLIAGPNGGNAITLSGVTDILDLNGRTLTLGASGVNSTISGNGVFRGSSASKIIINGTGAFGTVRFDQTTLGTSNLLSNLTLNRTATGGFVLGNDLNVSTDITIANGTIALGTSNLTVSDAGGTITVTPSATRMIIAEGTGQLRKVYGGNASFLFPIGDNSGNYTPATLNFTAGSYGGSAYAGVNITKAKYVSNTSTTDYINRYWTVTTSGITSPTCTVSFTYVTGDVVGTEANLYGGSYLPSTWTCLGVVNTGTNLMSSSVTTFGDFTAGELIPMGCCSNPTSGGIIANTSSSVCIGGTPNSFTSSAPASGQLGTLEYKWQSSTTGSDSGFIDTGANGLTYSPGALAVTTWFKRLSKVTCAGTWDVAGESNVVQITVDTANVWTAGAGTSAWTTPGNWSCGIPTSASDVTIDTADFYPIITSDVTINSLTINSGTALLVTSEYDLTVTDAIINNGMLTIENNANLLQTNNVANTGSGSTIVKRNSSLLKRLDFTLWSSPVTGQEVYDFSKFTLPNRFYVYDTANDVYSNSLIGFDFDPSNFDYPSPLVSPNGVNGTDDANIQFENGKGYLIRVPYNHPTDPTVYPGVFTGVANNGDISATVSTDLNGYNAVGNPYPSRLNVWNFIDGNTNITGPLYFWRKTNNSDPLSNAYATLTKIAYTENGSPGGDTGSAFFSSEGSQEQNWVINVGQGFIVKATSGSTIDFTNSMRRGLNSNQFFKNDQTVNTVDNGLYWLNLNTSSGSYSQMAVGYSSEATLAFDRGIDGENINKQFYLTSLIGTAEYSIQGRPDFDASDVVPLSYKASVAGNYSISIDHTDGLFTDASQPIYVKDNATATYHDLQTGAYSFASEAGTFSDRLEIVYAVPLGIETPVLTANNVIIYSQNNEFVVKSGNIEMSSIKIFDIRGRLLEEKKGINATQATIGSGLVNQVLLVQITSVNGITVTKKVVR